jgi:uncharacterized protein YodC (DUF2158 family)
VTIGELYLKQTPASRAAAAVEPRACVQGVHAGSVREGQLIRFGGAVDDGHRECGARSRREGSRDSRGTDEHAVGLASADLGGPIRGIRATSEMSTKTGGFAYLDLEAASDESSPGDRDGDQPGSWACRWYDGRQSRLT